MEISEEEYNLLMSNLRESTDENLDLIMLNISLKRRILYYQQILDICLESEPSEQGRYLTTLKEILGYKNHLSKMNLDIYSTEKEETSLFTVFKNIILDLRFFIRADRKLNELGKLESISEEDENCIKNINIYYIKAKRAKVFVKRLELIKNALIKRRHNIRINNHE